MKNGVAQYFSTELEFMIFFLVITIYTVCNCFEIQGDPPNI